MATEFFVPKLGQTVEEVTLIKWLVEDGAKVKRGQELLEVETDKAIFPVEANGKGFLHIGPYKEGDVVPVLTVVAIIGEENEVFSVGSGASAQEVAAEETAVEETAPVSEAETLEVALESKNSDRLFASPRAKKTAKEYGVDLTKVTATGDGGNRIVEADVLKYANSLPKITPVAKALAEQSGVDWTKLKGSGPEGKISKEDIEAVLAKPAAPVAAEVKPVFVPAVGGVQTPMPLPEVELIGSVPLSGVRKVIAERMGMSVHTSARVTLVMEVDATDFVSARGRLKDRYSKEWGFAVGYNDMLAKVVALALHKFPYMNARLTQTAIEHLAHVNVAMAVDTERGLLVPVVRDADKKSLQEFGTEFRALVDRARAGRALPDDLSGGTFTITNLGMYDVDAFTPVINLPEAAILGVGRIAPKPVVKDGAVVVRQMWTLSLVFDHRVVDGAPAARFLQYIKQVIEDPYLLLM